MTTTEHLPDLSHRTPAPRWLPTPLPERIEAAWLRERFDELLAAADGAGDEPAAWIELVLRSSELEAFVGTHAARIGIAYRQATDDPDATAEMERWNRDVSPVATDCSVDLARRVVGAPCTDALTERFGAAFMPRLEAGVRAHAPVNTALRTELSDVLMRHTKVFGTGTIEWRGERHPFSFAGKAALDTDRTHRHAAWQSKIDYVREHEAELQGVFDEAMVLRRRMADNLGQPSYVALRYLEMNRFDWTPEDAARVRAAIERHVVPVAAALQRRQAAALGTELLHPADTAITPEPAPQLAVDVDGQIEAATRSFDALGADFGSVWRMLVDEDLIDLAARPGKGTGAFCWGFAFEKVPYIFCNSVGSHDDVRTLVHEFGHALQDWRSRDIEPIELRHPTMEACEIHSMTLELLALPYLEPFFGSELPAFQLEHLRSTLDTVPYMAAIDEFQHRIYDEVLDAAGRAEAWRDLAQRYQPAIDWDADPWYGGGRWLLQLHVFQYPFYYLDYALARIVSWELWLESLEDEQAAIAKYLRLCEMGGTRPFRTMVQEAGLGDPFDEAVIERTMARLRAHLAID